MKKLNGKTISSGIAKGIVNLYSNEYEEFIPHYGIDEAQIPNEIERLKQSFQKAKSLMNEMIDLSTQSSDNQAAEIVNVHLMILTDPQLFYKMEQLIIQNKINAEHAINDIFNEYIDLHKKSSCIFRNSSMISWM